MRLLLLACFFLTLAVALAQSPMPQPSATLLPAPPQASTFIIESIHVIPPSGKTPSLLEVTVQADKDFKSKNLFAHASYFGQDKALIKNYDQPIPTSRKLSPEESVRNNTFGSEWPTVVQGKTPVLIHFPIPDKIPDKWNVVIAFGSEKGAVAKSYPDDAAVQSLAYADLEAVKATPANANITDKDEPQSLYEQKIVTNNPRYPVFTLLLHLPSGATSPKDVKGVLVLALPAMNVEELRTDVENPDHPVGGYFRDELQYAESRHLAIITWGCRWVFDAFDGYEIDTMKQAARDADFGKIVEAWDHGVQKWVDDLGIPSNGYLAYGTSNGAAWIQRMAMMLPNRFLAVHFHTCESLRESMPSGMKVLWLQTTGELDGFCDENRKFYVDARQANYPIMYKAVMGLSHRESWQAYELGALFFDYALALKANLDASPKVDGQPAPEMDLSGFASPPYYGDLMNQEMFPAAQKDMIPTGFLVPLPTKEMANVWIKQK